MGGGGDCGSGEAAERKLRLQLAPVRGVVPGAVEWIHVGCSSGELVQGRRAGRCWPLSKSTHAVASQVPKSPAPVKVQDSDAAPDPSLHVIDLTSFTPCCEDRSTVPDPDLELTPTRYFNPTNLF